MAYFLRGRIVFFGTRWNLKYFIMKMSDALRTERLIDEAPWTHDQLQQTAKLGSLCCICSFFSSFSPSCSHFKPNPRHPASVSYTPHHPSLKHTYFFLYKHDAIVAPNKVNDNSLVSCNNTHVS